MRRGGSGFVSACFKSKSPIGIYSDLISFQGYLFFTRVPYNTVFIILVLTDIADMGFKKTGYHYYAGTDPSIFRYPDEKLFHTGRIFSEREMEVIRLIPLLAEAVCQGIWSERIDQNDSDYSLVGIAEYENQFSVWEHFA